jgi:hypothetical protein
LKSSSLQKFYSRHHNQVGRYEISISFSSTWVHPGFMVRSVLLIFLVFYRTSLYIWVTRWVSYLCYLCLLRIVVSSMFWLYE